MLQSNRMMGFLASWVLFSSFIMMPSQLLDTKLEVTVRNTTGNLVADAEVILYETEKDYLDRSNEASKRMTNEKGIVIFDQLKTISYHLDVSKGAADNSDGGTKTAVLQKGRKNKTTVIIIE